MIAKRLITVLLFIGFFIVFLGIVAGCFSSCKGRTLKDVTPTGDTVEVEVTMPSDSI